MSLSRRNLVLGLTATALIFWLAETGYFGWNLTPQSHIELVCDRIAQILFLSAWLALLIPRPCWFRKVNPFRRVIWFYIERDGQGVEVVKAQRTTRLWQSLLLAAILSAFEKIIRALGVPGRQSRFLIVRVKHN
jgi:hypothetical protein